MTLQNQIFKLKEKNDFQTVTCESQSLKDNKNFEYEKRRRTKKERGPDRIRLYESMVLRLRRRGSSVNQTGNRTLAAKSYF